jgi:hypothetical protein
MNEPMHQKNKKGFGMQTKAPFDDGASKRGDLHFTSGKDACMSSNLKALHILVICYRKILNEVQQDCGQSKNH